MARYDGLARWYDETFSGYAAGPLAKALARSLGNDRGFCLDVGCGTGLLSEVVASTGRTVVGIDVSVDQLRVASDRLNLLLAADAARLPFADATFDSAVSTFTHTDVPYFDTLVREVSRV